MKPITFYQITAAGPVRPAPKRDRERRYRFCGVNFFDITRVFEESYLPKPDKIAETTDVANQPFDGHQPTLDELLRSNAGRLGAEVEIELPRL